MNEQKDNNQNQQENNESLETAASAETLFGNQTEDQKDPSVDLEQPNPDLGSQEAQLTKTSLEENNGDDTKLEGDSKEDETLLDPTKDKIIEEGESQKQDFKFLADIDKNVNGKKVIVKEISKTDLPKKPESFSKPVTVSERQYYENIIAVQKKSIAELRTQIFALKAEIASFKSN